MKEIALKYTAYNLWANRLLVDVLLSLPDEVVEKNLKGSFGSLRATAEHIWVAEHIWLQRLLMAEKVGPPNENLPSNFETVCRAWLTCSEALHHFTEKIFDDRGLLHEFHYYNIAGEQQKSSVWECLLHVANHGSFHRGQLVNYLRQSGVKTIPSTDFMAYCSGKK
jgi:uncharacterized damage-inducible protein DinB